MNTEIIIRLSTASQQDIINHFKRCDSDFLAALTARVDIAEYSDKLATKATRYEAWRQDDLVGLVAVYRNAEPGGFDFITDVSVITACIGQGIASRLLNDCIQATKSSEIRLEVSTQNLPAQKLYDKLGFTCYHRDQASCHLCLKIIKN